MMSATSIHDAINGLGSDFPTAHSIGYSKPLAPVACSAELVKLVFWAVWAEQHAPYTIFLPRIARNE